MKLNTKTTITTANKTITTKGDEIMKLNARNNIIASTVTAAAETAEPLAAAEIDEMIDARTTTERIRAMETDKLCGIPNEKDFRHGADFIDFMAADFNTTCPYHDKYIRCGYILAANVAARKGISTATMNGATECFPWIDTELYRDATAETRAAFGEYYSRYHRVITSLFDVVDYPSIGTVNFAPLRFRATDTVSEIILRELIRAMYRAADSVYKYRMRHAAVTYETMARDNGETTYKDIAETSCIDAAMDALSVAFAIREKLSKDEYNIARLLADGMTKKEICLRYGFGKSLPYSRAQIERGEVSEYSHWMNHYMEYTTESGARRVFVCQITKLNRIIANIKRQTASLAEDARDVLHSALDESSLTTMTVYKPISPEHCTNLDYLHKRVIRESGADYVKESRVGARKMPRRKAYTVPKAYNPDEYRKARRRDIKWAFESLETAPRGTYVYTDESGTRHVRNNSDYRDNDTTATKAAALPRVRIATGRAYTAAEMREMKRDECRAVWTYGGGNAYTAAEIREMKRNDCIRVFTAAKAAAPHIDKVVKATAATIEKRAAKAAPKATAKTAPKATAKAAAIRAEITAMKAEITAMKAARALTESATK